MSAPGEAVIQQATTTNSNSDFETVEQVRLAAAGNLQAFEALVNRYKSLVSSIALAIVRDVEISEEVAQDAFIAAWRRISELKNPHSFLPWLRQITRNRANDWLRRHVRNRKTFTSLESLPSSPGTTSPDLREKLIHSEDVRSVREALDSLPEETREILMLYYREGNSVRQVASLLDLTEDTVKKRLSRARRCLKEELETRASIVLARTRPTAAFTAAVISSLAFAAPVTATAAGIGVATKASPVALLGVIAGAIVGLACAVAAVVFGTRKMMLQAWDDEERRGLRLSMYAKIGVILCFAGFIVVWACFMDTPLKDHPTVALSLVAGYWLGLNALIIGWDRRVTRHRREIQRVEEPEIWRAEERRFAWGIVLSVSILIVSLVGLGIALYLRRH